MKSEIRVSTPKIKIYVTIGVTMFLIAVVAMVLYPDAIRAILYSTAAVILMYGGSRGIGWLGGVALKMAHGYQGLRRERLDNDRVQIENDERRLKSKIMIVSRTDGYIRLDTDDYYGPAMVGSAPVVDSTARQLPDGEQRRLMALFAQFIHWLLIGPTQTGKTTLMNHLIDAYEPDAIIYVGDPHSKLNIWSTRAEVVGRGREVVLGQTAGPQA